MTQANERPGARKRFERMARSRKTRRTVLVYAAFVLFVVWILLPFWFTLASSLSKPADMLARPPRWVSADWSLDNYVALFTRVEIGQGGGQGTAQVGARFPRAVLASGLIGGAVVAANLVIGSLAGYAFSRLPYRGSRYLFVSLLVTRVIPPITLVVPIFVVIRTFALINSPIALVIVYTLFTLPFAIWLLKGYFDGLPVEVEEAARVDGASQLQIMRLIVAPLAKPGLVATGLLVFLEVWSEFFYAAVLTNQMTVPPVLVSFQHLVFFSWTSISAATVIGLLPPLLVAMLFQRYIVRGLTQGFAR